MNTISHPSLTYTVPRPNLEDTLRSGVFLSPRSVAALATQRPWAGWMCSLSPHLSAAMPASFTCSLSRGND